ncbi:MAG: hypothetical protein KAS62_11585, partial [Candidatus Delongbacteria bacterium]|nr:hypothetical protein [Candidatus Delongbacteria bacterium]
MKYITIILLLMLTTSFSQSKSFKEDQERYKRVRQAYSDKGAIVETLLTENKINIKELNIYLRAFKKEKIIELWGKNSSEEKYKIIKKYEVCASSGKIGPKRKQGDY